MEDRTQPGGKLLIEEFYEYGGKAVCSNHVFNFKIGKFAFAQSLIDVTLVEEESDLVTDRISFFHPMFTHQVSLS
jgi:hypothetical protein